MKPLGDQPATGSRSSEFGPDRLLSRDSPSGAPVHIDTESVAVLDAADGLRQEQPGDDIQILADAVGEE